MKQAEATTLEIGPEIGSSRTLDRPHYRFCPIQDIHPMDLAVFWYWATTDGKLLEQNSQSALNILYTLIRWKLNLGFLILNQDDTLHGFGSVIPESRGFGYMELFVTPEARRSLKLSWRAANRLVNLARDMGMKALGIGVVEPPARRLAASMGFVDTGRDIISGARIMVLPFTKKARRLSHKALAKSCFPDGKKRHPETRAACCWAWSNMRPEIVSLLRSVIPPGSGFATGAPWLTD